MSNEERGQAGGAAERGNLIVVSAPSGAGKSSLVDMALRRIDRLRYSISYTTRKARGAERHGVEYYFVGEDEFRSMRERGDFLESAEVHGYLYGTHRAAIDQMLGEGLDVVLDIDVKGAEQIREQVPEAVSVFVMPPSREVLEARLRLRNLNEPADIARRLANAASEVERYDRFDYVIVNDDLDRASAALEAIIIAERSRPERQRSLVTGIIATFGGDIFHA